MTLALVLACLALTLVLFGVALIRRRAASFHAMYLREVDRGLARPASTRPVTEADLAPLPPLVQTYLRRVGVVGRPHVHDVRVRWRGVMKSKPDAEWMPADAEQYDFFDEPSRVFLMGAELHRIPFQALHVYVGPSATMRVRIAGALEVVHAHGPEMNRSETVTLFNDICFLAPGALVDANVAWEAVDARTVRGTFTNAGNTIAALLSFDKHGDLVDFTSNDRSQTADGKTYRTLPWSTPMHDYTNFGGARLASRGEAVWAEPEGDYVYARLEVIDVTYNVGPRVEGPEGRRAATKAHPSRIDDSFALS